MSITRLGTANMYDRTISNISKQQAELASQMEHTSAGKRVLRASDDPVAAAQAERARTRLDRIETDQRMLKAQTATIEYAEGTLGEINDAVQEFRSLLVQAGNGTYNQTQRDTLVEQLTSLRDQIQKYSNRTDSNGLPLFRGLDTKSNTPFPNGSNGIQSGQTNSNEYTITNSLDGGLAFFSGSTGNGVLAVDIDGANTGKAWADVGTITDPNATDLSATGPLTITFGEDADGNPTYSITYQQEDPANPGTFLTVPWEDANGDPVTDIAYKSGEAITVAGMKLTITGDTEVGDKFTVKPSTDQSIFDVLDQAIAEVKNNVKTDGSTDHGALAHGLAKSLAEIDTQLNRVSTVRGVAGDLLNQATRMGNTLLARNEQVEAQRVAAEDYDTDGMVKALSQLKTQETAVSAALQSYASIQKLSLFDYIR
ncbi:flagellar hook-associated protein FlgL [Comamonas aquatica]|uniref:flagellar hook-associated protein FlgL n=1 Tax=Comamonas aquatica TaxID=225991 RepID=UPI002447790D|nr:flagellar hook-associated protein FlgL [Comamonas aquatica]MDH1379174.1 flagellar hook-associated protein FlgL [Comamonas aquatica]MDH1639118.1 flagellar hook-associated protein FlgL [Comamonas aquatica]